MGQVEYLVFTGAGLRAVYAIMGIANTGLGSFTPYLMGVKRGVTTSPDPPATGQNIILDTYLDLTVPITIDSPLSIGIAGPARSSRAPRASCRTRTTGPPVPRS